MDLYDLNDVKSHYEFLSHKKQTEIRLIVDKDMRSKYQESEWSKSIYIKCLEELINIVKSYSGERHIYIGVNERRENGSKINDIDTINNFVLDIDNKTNLIETQQIIFKIKEEALSQGFQEPLIISSGNGYHIYFSIKPIDNSNENRNKIKAVGKSIKDKYQNDFCIIDDSVFEPARVMRLAGTMNIKTGVNSLSRIINNVNRIEDELFSKKILQFEIDNRQSSRVDLPKDILDKIKNDFKINSLFNGDIEGFESRSEAELSLVERLIRIGLNKEQIFSIMSNCRIGKWNEANIQYRELTYKKSLAVITKEKESFREKNPYKNLNYETRHLPFFDKMNKLIGLYGKHYLPIKKARWYQLIGGTLQKEIYLGGKHTDTRIESIYALPTEQGKNDLIYLFKDIVGSVKKGQECFRIEEPISYHPEQLIGKVIEVLIDNPSYKRGLSPKKISIKQENRGYFDCDFVEIDEANSLIFNNDDQTRQAREYISKALNPIGRNEVVKKSVDDLPSEKVSYCPKCTFTLYFQPKKINEDLFLQGFLRRFLIPVGNIQPFLNYGNEEEFKSKTKTREFSREEVKQEFITYLEIMRTSLKEKSFLFSQEAVDKINFYHQYLITEGQVHSEKIANLTKLIKWTLQDYLIKMSCILAGAYKTNVVEEHFVSLAFMDLVELLQSSFDFLNDWVIGNFDYGVNWKGAKYKDKTCLEYLYERDCYTEESSKVKIAEFQGYIMEVFGVKQTRAREIFSNYKKNKWIDSKQVGQDDSRVWLGFIPETQNLISEGDKGNKGFALYKSVVSGISGILTSMSPSSPSSPLNNFEVSK